MKACIFDTENTKKIQFKLRSHDPEQPKLLQIAAFLVDLDSGEIERECCHYVKPEGWEIDERLEYEDGTKTAFAVNDISNAKAQADGIPLGELLPMFDVDFMAPSAHAYAFSAGWDRRQLRISAAQLWGEGEHPRKGDAAPDWFCIMRTMTPICDLPPSAPMIARNMKGPKTPSLMEAHQHAFGEGFDGAHDAMADLRATYRLWTWVREHHQGKFVQLAAKD